MIFSVTVTAIIGIIALSAAVEGYFKSHLNPLMRIILAAGAFMLIVPETLTDVLGVAIVGLVAFWNIMQSNEQAGAQGITYRL